MQRIEIRPITKENKEALGLSNDPFKNTGLVIPSYNGREWTYEIKEFSEDEITEDCFPDENYVFEEMGSDCYGLAAYIGDECVGFAILRKQWNKFLYLDNLLVLAKFRRQGVATALMEAALELAEDLDKIGVWLICQDNNLSAMKFYFSVGFEIGGLDTRAYDGTSQEGKKDIYLYLPRGRFFR